MNEPNKQHEQLQNDCQAYLLGELSGQTLSEFESKLGNPDVAEELIRQSHLLVAISSAEITQEPISHLQTIEQSPALLSWKTPAILLAVAAAFLLIVSITQPNDDQTRSVDSSLDLQIAKAWVEQPGTETNVNDSEFSIDWLTEPEFETMEDFDEPSDAASWLVAAVAAEENNVENNVDG